MMKNIIDYNNFALYVGYSFILLPFLITTSILPNTYLEFYDINRLFKIFAYLLLIISILSNFKSSLKLLIFFLLLIIVSLGSRLNTGSEMLMTICLVMMAAHGHNIKSLIKIDIVMRLLFLCFLIVLYVMNIVPDLTVYRDGEIRHSLGFAHPNRLGSFLLVTTMYILYLLDSNKYNIFLFIICLLSLVSSYFITYSRTASVGLLLVLITVFFCKSNNLFFRYLRFRFEKISIFIFISSLLSSFLLPFFYLIGVIHINIAYVDSNILSRVYLSANGLLTYGVTLLGQKIEFYGTTAAQQLHIVSNGIDNAYFYLLIQYGVIPFIVILLLFLFTIRKLWLFKDYKALAFFNILVLACTMENQFINIESNIFLLYSFESIYMYSAYNFKK